MRTPPLIRTFEAVPWPNGVSIVTITKYHCPFSILVVILSRRQFVPCIEFGFGHSIDNQIQSLYREMAFCQRLQLCDVNTHLGYNKYQCLQFSSLVSAYVGKYYSKLWLSAHEHLLERLWLVRNIVSCEVKLQNMMMCT